MTSMLDRPLKWRRISGISRRRRLADSVATVLVTSAMLIALAPLIWVLWSVVVRGFRSLTSSVWWTHSQAGTTAFEPGGVPTTRSWAPCCSG